MILRNYESLAAFESAIAKYRTPPADAIKQQTHGARLSSINSQWRVDALTSLFGPYGLGWWTESEAGDWKANGVNCVYVRLRLCFRLCIGGEEVTCNTGWHTGGTPIDRNDEAVKMAETDALGKAASFLGIGAAIYRGEADGDKYSKSPYSPAQASRGSTAQQDAGSRVPARPRAVVGDPGSFIVPFGNSKGRTIRELSDKENQGSLDFMTGKNMTGPYREALTAWLESREASQVDAGSDVDDEEAVPF